MSANEEIARLRLDADECARLRPLYEASRDEVLRLTRELARVTAEIERLRALIDEEQIP